METKLRGDGVPWPRIRACVRSCARALTGVYATQLLDLGTYFLQKCGCLVVLNAIPYGMVSHAARYPLRRGARTAMVLRTAAVCSMQVCPDPP